MTKRWKLAFFVLISGYVLFQSLSNLLFAQQSSDTLSTLFQIQKAERPHQNILFFVNGDQAFNLRKLLKEINTPLYSIYCVESQHILHYPTANNMHKQTKLISNIFKYFVHDQQHIKVILVGIDSVCQAVLRFLAQTPYASLISKVILINHNRSEKHLYFEELEFASKTRKSLLIKRDSLAHIVILSLTSKKKLLKSLNFLILSRVLPNCIQLNTNQVWNTYRMYSSSMHLFGIPSFKNYFFKFINQQFSYGLNYKQTKYFWMYHEMPESKIDQLMQRKKFCKQSLLLKNEPHSEYYHVKCFKLVFKPSRFQFSLSIHSNAPFYLITQSMQIMPYLEVANTTYLYFLEKIPFRAIYLIAEDMNTPKIYVYMINYRMITSLDSIQSMEHEQLQKTVKNEVMIKIRQYTHLIHCSDKQNRIIFPQKILKCEYLDNPLIIQFPAENLWIQIDYYSYYAQILYTYRGTQDNLIFSNLVMLTMLDYQFHQVFIAMFLSLCIIDQQNHRLYALFIYSVYILSLSTALFNILKKCEQYRKQITVNKLAQCVVIVLPFLIMLSNIVGMRFFVTEWMALIFAQIFIVHRQGHFIGIYLTYISSQYIAAQQLNLHFVPILSFIFVLYFYEHLSIYEYQKTIFLKTCLAWGTLFFCNQNLAVIHFLLEMYICGVVLVLFYFVVKKQRMLRSIYKQF